MVCSGHDQRFELGPGQARVTIPIVGPYSWRSGTNEPVGASEGAFRLFYRVYPCSYFDSAMSPSLTRSLAFRICPLQ